MCSADQTENQLKLTAHNFSTSVNEPFNLSTDDYAFSNSCAAIVTISGFSDLAIMPIHCAIPYNVALLCEAKKVSTESSYQNSMADIDLSTMKYNSNKNRINDSSKSSIGYSELTSSSSCELTWIRFGNKCLRITQSLHIKRSDIEEICEGGWLYRLNNQDIFNISLSENDLKERILEVKLSNKSVLHDILHRIIFPIYVSGSDNALYIDVYTKKRREQGTTQCSG